jgi:hypothetical protein
VIDFKIIELSDKKAIDACLAYNTLKTCDLCFANLLAWQTKFKTEFSIIKGTLFIRYFENNANSFSLCNIIPVGKMNLHDSLTLIIEDAKDNNVNFVMKITSEMWNEINEAFPNTFQYQLDRDNDEYIYLSEKLIRLSGNKLQSKRNHINRFKKENPDWNYFPILSKEDLDDCSVMLDKWDNLNIDKAKRSLRYDYIATKIMIDNFHYLQLKGGAIKANGKIIAFTIGEQLTNNTFVIHVEKAFSDMNGAYTIINQQFAEHEASDFLYINREEDMGLDNLRKAKMSYYPHILLQKRVLTLIEEPK